MKSAAGVVLGLMMSASLPGVAQTPILSWVASFEESPFASSLPGANDSVAATGLVTGTLRYRFGISVGGSQVIVRLSNELGDRPLKLAGASIAIAGNEMDAIPGTVRRLTFNGKPGVTIPAGAPILSDPVQLRVPGMADLLGTVFVTDTIKLTRMGGAAMVLTGKDDVMTEQLTEAKTVTSRPLITSVLVMPQRPTHVVVALGDSITDGVRDKPSQPHGWVATLAGRLNAVRNPEETAAVSAGISGNQLLKDMLGPSALSRADRDVFATPGITHVVLLEGINDIGFSRMKPMGDMAALTLEDLVTAYKQLAARARNRGVKIYIGTLTPIRGTFYFSEEREQLRQAVNAWIRTTKDFDGVIDFEAVVRDPNDTSRLKAEFDSGDHLHPNADGYKAMGNAIELSMFK